MCFLGMLVGLFGEFVGGQMIRFVVTGSIMSVLRKIVKFSRHGKIKEEDREVPAIRLVPRRTWKGNGGLHGGI